MKPLKPLKPKKESHCANTKYGMGDYYGVGIKNKVARIRDDSVGGNPVIPKKLRKPPKSLA